MEHLLSVFIGLVSLRFLYKNIKLQEQLSKTETERDNIKKQINRYFMKTKIAIAESRKHMEYRYQSELWKADSEQLVDELLKRTDDEGQPIFIAHCVSDEFTKNRLVSLIVKKKIVLGS